MLEVPIKQKVGDVFTFETCALDSRQSASQCQRKSEETFSYIRDMLQEGIDNIEKAMVRNEYKLWM